MTDMVKSEGAVIKTDELGRVRTPAERREGLLDEFERSGLSGQKFAALARINFERRATFRSLQRLLQPNCSRFRKLFDPRKLLNPV